MPRTLLRDDNGIVSNIFYQEKPLTVVLPQMITVYFLKLFSGSPLRAHRGETFPWGLDWHRVYVRYNRWTHKGAWAQIFSELSKDKDFEYLMVDDSITRVHQHGVPKKHLNMIKQLANPEVV